MRRDARHVYVIVHTVASAVGEREVRAHFVRAVDSGAAGNAWFCVRVRVRRRAGLKAGAGGVRHRLRAFKITIPPEINQVPNQLVSVPSKPLPAPPLPTLQIQSTLPVVKETSISDSVSSAHQYIHPNSEPEEITAWLIGNRFQKYIETFSNYSGSDMLRLSRNDLIQMCGQADGIRLFNALYSKIIRPKLKLYICRNQSNIYNAIYLSSFSAEELMHKLSAIVNVSSGQIQGLYLEGPNYIQIHLTDEVIGNLKDGGTFLLDIVTENNSYVFLLKPIGKQ